MKRSPLNRGAILPALVIATILSLSACYRSSTSAAAGTRIVLPEPVPVSDYQLTDQNGHPFDSKSLAGKPVVYSFLYTSCTDTCSYEAVKIKQLIDMLGDDAGRVAFVAIDTDPGRDTVETLKDYTQKLGLDGKWHFLTGSEEALNKIYADFAIAIAKQTVEEANATQENSNDLGIADRKTNSANKTLSPTRGLESAQLALASDLITQFGGGYEVAHSAPIWFVNADGERQVAMGPASTPKELYDEVMGMLD